MKLQITPAIILGHSNYGEADRIVSFLTPDHGRLKGFARSARKSRKRFGAGLEPFAEVYLHWAPRANGSLVSLQAVELVTLRQGVRRTLETIALASYGCELVNILFEESGAAPELYRLLQAFLDHLNQEGYSVEARLLLELRILELAGYMPHLQHCASCNNSLPEGSVGFSVATNGSLCAGCGGDRLQLQVDRLTLGTLGRILRTPLHHFSGFRLSPLSRREGLAILAEALGGHLQRPMKSLSFLNSLVAQSTSDEAR